VDGAVNEDKFLLNDPALSETERVSSSVVDVFRSLNQSIKQISGLRWDDDIQYAEFMTAFAKLVGIGLARYCDMVERMFNKEMDRPTAEQELQLTRTRQERWLRLAKDVVTAKEKVEPYEFLAGVSLMTLIGNPNVLISIFLVFCKAQQHRVRNGSTGQDAKGY